MGTMRSGIHAGLAAGWLRIAVCMVCVVFVGTRAVEAAPIPVVDGAGKLTGALGVDVGGTLYDVTFVDGSCVTLFSGCDDASDFDFTTQADAVAAAQALIDQVFVDSPLGNFDSNPALTFGCDADTCNTMTPFGTYFGTFLVGDAVQSTSFDLAFGAAIGHANYGSSPHYTFARWNERPQVPVTEPASLILLASGALALGATLRVRRRDP